MNTTEKIKKLEALKYPGMSLNERSNINRKINRLRNPEKYREAGRRYGAKNRERIRQKAAEWRKANPERVKDHNRTHRQLRMQFMQYIKELKKWTPCAMCAGTFPPECMDWDHIDTQDKVGCVSRLRFTAPPEAVLTEIAKCRLICSNCHRTVSKQQTLERWSER